MERLIEMATAHRYTRNGMRINVDQRPENRVQDKSGRTWLRQGPYSNTVREGHPIVEHVQSMGIPCDSVCLNRRRADSPTPPMGPHRDGKKHRTFLDCLLGAAPGRGRTGLRGWAPLHGARHHALLWGPQPVHALGGAP